jgi:hypothetical protein
MLFDLLGFQGVEPAAEADDFDVIQGEFGAKPRTLGLARNGSRALFPLPA